MKSKFQSVAIEMLQGHPYLDYSWSDFEQGIGGRLKKAGELSLLNDKETQRPFLNDEGRRILAEVLQDLLIARVLNSGYPGKGDCYWLHSDWESNLQKISGTTGAK